MTYSLSYHSEQYRLVLTYHLRPLIGESDTRQPPAEKLTKNERRRIARVKKKAAEGSQQPGEDEERSKTTSTEASEAPPRRGQSACEAYKERVFDRWSGRSAGDQGIYVRENGRAQASYAGNEQAEDSSARNASTGHFSGATNSGLASTDIFDQKDASQQSYDEVDARLNCLSISQDQPADAEEWTTASYKRTKPVSDNQIIPDNQVPYHLVSTEAEHIGNKRSQQGHRYNESRDPFQRDPDPIPQRYAAVPHLSVNNYNQCTQPMYQAASESHIDVGEDPAQYRDAQHNGIAYGLPNGTDHELPQDIMSLQQRLWAAENTIRVGTRELQDLQNQCAYLDSKRKEAEDRAGKLQSHMRKQGKGLQKELESANDSKATAEILLKAGDQASERMRSEIQGLLEKVKQLEIQAAFNKIGDGSVDVPARLDGILKELDVLSEPIVDQLSTNFLESKIKYWEADLTGLPQRVVDFVKLCKRTDVNIEVSFHYAIPLLVMSHIEREIWNVTFHPIASTLPEFDAELRKSAATLQTVYADLVEKEPYIRSSNWRVLTQQTLWNACTGKLGGGNLATTLDYMTTEHVDYVIKKVIAVLLKSSPARSLNYGIFREKLYDIIRDVLQLKYDSQIIDARYEYRIDIPSVPFNHNDTLSHDSPISCKFPKYVRWEASSDARSPRVTKVQEQAKFHTAGEAGWVPKPKKG